MRLMGEAMKVHLIQAERKCEVTRRLQRIRIIKKTTLLFRRRERFACDNALPTHMRRRRRQANARGVVPRKVRPEFAHRHIRAPGNLQFVIGPGPAPYGSTSNFNPRRFASSRSWP